MANFTARGEAIVSLNGSQAESVLKTMKEQAKGLKTEIKRLRDLDPMNPNLPKMEKQLQTLNTTTAKVVKTTFEYQKVLKNLNGASLYDLQKTKQTLISQIKRMTAGTKEFIATSKQIQTVNTRITQINTSLKAQESGWNKISNSFNKYIGLITTGLAAMTGVTMTLRSVRDEAAKMSDAYADVMKTTGMTADEVKAMNEEFKKMDTRTSREQLNQLAYDAGKLGIAKKDVLDFVKASDQINIALGDVLGDEATHTIGKISEVFGQSSEQLKNMSLESKMISIGSAINELGKTSTANEQYLVDFTARLGGVAAQAKISVQDLLGYGSGLDQSMQQLEVSATTMSQLIVKMMKDPARFAEIAGVKVEEFTKILSEDANAAIITLLKSLNQSGGFDRLVPLLDDMQLSGSRAVGVLSALATNIDKVESAQQISNKAFSEGTSMLGEYEIKNNSLAAKVEKSRKKISDLKEEIGSKLGSVLTSANKLMLNALNLLINMPKSVYALIAALVLWKSTEIILIGLMKAKTVALAAWTVAQNVATAASGLFTGNLLKMAIAWRSLSSAMKTNVFILAASAIVGVVMAIKSWISETNKIGQAYSAFQAELNKEIATLDILKDSVLNAAMGTNERAEAINQINEKYGEYLPNLLTEKSTNEEITIALAGVNSQLEENLRLKYLQSEKQRIFEERAKAEKALLETVADRFGDNTEKLKLFSAAFRDATKEVNAGANPIQAYVELLKKFDANSSSAQIKLINLINTIKSTNAEMLRANSLFGSTSNTAKTTAQEPNEPGYLVKPSPKKNTTTTNTGGSVGKDKNKEKNDAYTKELKEVDKQAIELLNIEKQNYLNREITQQQFETRSIAISENALKEKIKIAQKYAQDDAQLQSNLLDLKIKRQDDFNKEIDKQLDELYKSNEKVYDEINKAIEASIDQEIQDEEEKERRRQQILQQYGIDGSEETERYSIEIEALKTAREQELITEEEYAKAKSKLKLKELQKYIKKAQLLQNAAADMVGALQEAETTKVDAEYEKQHTALKQKLDAGIISEDEYNTEKDRLDNEAAQKKLDIEKKYADVNFAVKISQIIASTAMAIMQAYAELGPIAGSVAAAMLTVTGIAQIAAAKAERDKVKNMTLENSSSSSSSGDTKNKRVVIPGKESGGYVQREQDGKVFYAKRSDERGFVSSPTVLVGENGNEFVANASAVNNPSIKPILDIIDLAQRNGSVEQINLPHILNNLDAAHGFANGGYANETATVNTTNTINTNSNNKLMKQLLTVLTKIEAEGVNATVVLSDLQKKQKLLEKSQKLGSKTI